MPITSNTVQNNIVINSTPELQEWGITPAVVTVNYYQGTAIPAPLNIDTVFKDIVGTAEASGYSNLNYRTYVGIAAALPTCVVLSGSLYTGASSAAIYSNGMQGAMLYTFQNLNLLSPGQYSYYVYHQIRGSKVLGDIKTISEFVVRVNIRVFTANSPTISVNAFNYTRTIGNAELINKFFTVSGDSWLLQVPRGLVFVATGGVTVNTLPDGSSTAFGTGTKNMTLVCNDQVVPAVITSNPLELLMDVNDSLFSVPVSVILMRNSGLFLSKELMEFTAYKGISEAPEQQLTINYNAGFKLSYPAWLIISDSVSSGRGVLRLKVLSSNNIEAGTYTGKLVIRKTSDNTVLGEVALIYNVLGQIKSPYIPGKPSFTLDRVFLNLSSVQENIYYDVAVSVKAYDAYASSFKETVVPMKVPLFNKQQSLNIGQIVHRLMKSPVDLKFKTGRQYQVAVVNLGFTEKSFDDPAYEKKYYIQNLTFLAGLLPALVNNSGFLNINAGASRVTLKSIAYLNFYANTFYSLIYFINGLQYIPDELMQRADTGVLGRLIDFNKLGVRQGDVVEARLNVGGMTTSKFFKVFPEGYESNHIVWENEYRLLSVMEFTGKYDIKSEIENRTQTLYDKLVDELVKIESTKISRLIINTGFLLKSDIPSIESLCRSKRAALMHDDILINMVPVTKTLITVDSDMELVAFDIEFEINRNYNEEIYSF